MLSQCCWGIPLHKGCMILSVIGILHGVVAFLVGLWLYSDMWYFMVYGWFHLISYTWVLVGIIKGWKQTVLIAVANIGEIVVLGIVFGMINIASIASTVPKLSKNCEKITQELKELNTTCDALKSSTMGMASGIVLASVFLNIYSWICIYSLLKELKEKKGSREHVN